MLQALINVFRIAELRNKILFTLGLLAIYRIGYWIPLPGVDQQALAKLFQQSSDEGGPFGRAANFIAMFTGGTFSQSTVFGLGIMPYISASIIIQLLTTVYPKFKKMQEEGATGRQKIMEITRYITIALCIVQGIGWLKFITGSENLVYTEWAGNPIWWVMALAALTAGTMFLMWLGEQIDKYGIGNGVSMIIMAGIVARIPFAIADVYKSFGPGDETKMGWLGLIFLVLAFVGVVAGSVIMTVAQRRIPVQQAKHTKGQKVFGGQKSYLPLRVNHSGVMPIVFASSLMIFPSVIFGMVYQQSATSLGFDSSITRFFNWLSDNFNNGQFLFMIGEMIMIYFFAYFWITVQFNPEEMAKQLRDHGSFIPGLRPGPRTAEYLEAVMERITFVGATMLAVIAVLPSAISTGLGVDYAITQFLGGTGMLIVVSVVLDFMQRVEANLLMRNYAGFLGAQGGSGPKIQSARSM